MGQSVLPKSADRTRIGENFDIFDWSIPYDLMAKFSWRIFGTVKWNTRTKEQRIRTILIS